MLLTKEDLFQPCPSCREVTPYPLIIRHGCCNKCRNRNGRRCLECCGDGFVYVENKGNVCCLIAVPCQCVPSRHAELDELHDLLDCIQADGSIAGLDEFAPDGSATSTLCQTLYDLLVAYDDLRTRDREVNTSGRFTETAKERP